MALLSTTGKACKCFTEMSKGLATKLDKFTANGPVEAICPGCGEGMTIEHAEEIDWTCDFVDFTGKVCKTTIHEV